MATTPIAPLSDLSLPQKEQELAKRPTNLDSGYAAAREARKRMQHANELARAKGRPDSFPPEKQNQE